MTFLQSPGYYNLLVTTLSRYSEAFLPETNLFELVHESDHSSHQSNSIRRWIDLVMGRLASMRHQKG